MATLVLLQNTKDGSTCIINVIQNRLKGGNHMVNSMDEGKILDKVQHPLQDEMTEETQKRRNMFGHNKKASHDNTVLNEEILGAFPPKSITKQSVYSLYFPSIYC